jgi:Fe-Mn family superoxide dismutase
MTMSFELPQLPYAKDALVPYMSAETFDYHLSKHHAAYINKLNELIAGKPEANKSLEEIILSSDGALFNQAAQHWNHSFFWKCLRPNGGGKPSGDLAAAIDRDFGSYDAFKQQLAAKAVGQFGSGWAWLVAKDGKLSVTSTANADLPLKHGQSALLTIDVWEHAYYVDYRNARPVFVETVIDKLINWDFVAENLKNAR